jgi:hypothetical protein
MRNHCLALLLASLVAPACAAGHRGPVVPRRCSFDQSPLARDTERLTRQGVLRRNRDQLLHATRGHLLVLDPESPPGRRVRVLQRPGYRVQHTLDWAEALVEDDSGRLLGLLGMAFTHGTPRVTFFELDGRGRWGIEGLGIPVDERAATLVHGGQLVVAIHGRGVSYAVLASFDLGSGTLRWQAPVRTRGSHDQRGPYDHHVTIERRGSSVVVRGFESAGCYVQAFDLETGRPR